MDIEVTQADRDALEEIDDALGFLMDNERGIVAQAFARHRQASIAQHGAERGEPVALLHEHPNGDRELELYRFGAGCLTNADKAAGWTETPLYAHPPTARNTAPADRNAVLEDAEALDALCRTFERWLKIGPSNQPTMPGSSIRPFSTGDLKAFVRGLRSLRSTEAPAQGGE